MEIELNTLNIVIAVAVLVYSGAALGLRHCYKHNTLDEEVIKSSWLLGVCWLGAPVWFPLWFVGKLIAAGLKN